MAHPVRPDSYIEISNFYTVTIYEKGAEVVRMIKTLAGDEGFRKGTDLYFDRHDGQAVTTDDFVKAIEDANQIDLSQFRRWYQQAGTPELTVETEYDEIEERLTMTVTQSCPATPGQTEKLPFHIPLAVGLLDKDGESLPLQLAGEGKAYPAETRVLSHRSNTDIRVYQCWQ
jgi:aminopeptidase N